MIESIAQQFTSGGPFMWVILIVFGVAFAVALERIIYYFIINRKNSRELVADIANAINDNEFEAARELTSKGKTPLYMLLNAAVERYIENPDTECIQEGIEETAIKELPKLSKRINYLSLFANVATLLGLLGTIAGLQVSFSSLGSVDAAQKASMLASGISQAMNTTAFGLIVAVPCMIIYTMLNNKQESIVKDIDESVIKLVNFMKRKTA